MQDSTTRARTADRGPPTGEELRRVYTIGEIGPKRHMTPSGFLVCQDVPIARTGMMRYMRGEIPAEADEGGFIDVERVDIELFNEKTMASFMACPVTDEHPNSPDGVTPENWRELAGGFSTTNIRRGEGPDSDVLLADLVITRPDLIEAVMNGKREVSCGYDASYEQVRPGFAYQRKIIGNHIALVSRGRCGPRCAIGDHDPTATAKEAEMPASKDGAVKRHRVSPEDLAAITQAVGSAFTTDDEPGEEGGAIHIHVHGNGAVDDKPPGKTGDAATSDKAKDGEDDPVDSRFKAVESTVDGMKKTVDTLCETVKVMGDSMKAFMSGKAKDAEEDPKGEAEKEQEEQGKKTGDSGALASSWQDLLSKAEILVPGFKPAMTFDAALPRAQTVDHMCSVRRSVLKSYGEGEGKAALGALMEEGQTLDSMACGEVAVLFKAAASAKAQANNRAAIGDAARVPNSTQTMAAPKHDIASIEKANREFWARQGAIPH